MGSGGDQGQANLGSGGDQGQANLGSGADQGQMNFSEPKKPVEDEERGGKTEGIKSHVQHHSLS